MYSHCLNIFFTNSNNNVTQRLVWSRHCITLQLINSLLKNTITGHSWRLLTFGTLMRTHDLTSQKTMTETRPFRRKNLKSFPFFAVSSDSVLPLCASQRNIQHSPRIGVPNQMSNIMFYQVFLNIQSWECCRQMCVADPACNQWVRQSFQI